MSDSFMDLIYPKQEKQVEEPAKPETEDAPVRKEVTLKKRVPYWAVHKYERRSTTSIRYFCGWERLVSLIDGCKLLIDKGLIATLFETGGRASEVLSLTKGQFKDKQHYIQIVGMTVLKQSKDENRYRQVPILKSDPLVKWMMEWVETTHTERVFPYKYHWLYKKIRDLERSNKEKHGPWWPHRFRAERASQLAVEKNFTVPQLMKWFGWVTGDMATHYVKMSVEDLVKKMAEGQM